MATPTVTGGSINGTSFTFTASSALQNFYAQQIIASANALTASLVSGTTTITKGITVDVGSGGTITGSSAVPSPFVLLDGTGQTYVSGINGSTDSVVVAQDNANATIENTNPNGYLTAYTGAGSNNLVGFGLGDSFTTGVGGNDQVQLFGASNNLVSNGSDAVLVGGPSTIQAGPTGLDNISIVQPTTLAFINGSATGVDSISAGSNSIVSVAGTGATSITAGTGPESFFVDTSAGNVTLNGNLDPSNTFEFVKDANVSTGAVTVNNFASGDSVLVHNYSAYGVTASSAYPSGSVLVLSDGAQVTFTNVSVATLQATVKTV